MTGFVHLVHSLALENGGVAEAVNRLNDEMNRVGMSSRMSENQCEQIDAKEIIIAHGLWQWPGLLAWQNFKKCKTRYLVFPHGMMDPWFKKTYPIKHIKKQIYWWYRQSKIMREAFAVCFTTEEERLLAQDTFVPYRCNEVVTGMGVSQPLGKQSEQQKEFFLKFPALKNKKLLLYLGRFHPKKGVDLLINSFLEYSQKDSILVLAGPINTVNPYEKSLMKLTRKQEERIIWTGMLQGDIKWGALSVADALILPSHQENYGMVVAEAFSVGTPVFLTNKVNLWREVVECQAGIVSKDDQVGINELIIRWVANEHSRMKENAMTCFNKKMHIKRAVERIVSAFE